jgi:histidine triad (HIT) family protein
MLVDFRREFWYIRILFEKQRTAMAECEFCRIVRGETAAEVLFKSEHALAILDINPIHFGHVLVMPLRHYATFLEVPGEELSGLINAVRTVSQAVVRALQPPGFNIFSNNGKAAGQSVFHFHFHITPRYDDDNIRFVLTLKKYVGDDMVQYANRIRSNIQTDAIQELL